MAPNSIILIHDNNKWIVVLVENGDETRREFAFEQHAQSWLYGQRIRLGLHSTRGSGAAEDTK